MAKPLKITAVGTGDEYVHVRFRDPDQFDEIRTPGWAREVAASVVVGSEVRMGRNDRTGGWTIQRVQIPKADIDEQTAMKRAKRIVGKIHD
ncbi:hypothetical protein [Haloarcula marina]|uniref:hypothetical protein n=1 Tax=Haloarcula marina TaxID=2961574 RepID=UPI0020B835D6|nr:hypothetical protein [Halomicroarcula marina]